MDTLDCSPQFYVYVQTVDTRLFFLSCGAVTWENEARNFYAAVVSVLLPHLSTPLITTLVISSAVLLTSGGLQAIPAWCMVPY